MTNKQIELEVKRLESDRSDCQTDLFNLRSYPQYSRKVLLAHIAYQNSCDNFRSFILSDIVQNYLDSFK